MSIYNVMTYGAVNNNTADDTSAIQSAINAANTAGGGQVYFPAGAGYHITGPLTAYGNIRYHGDQWKASVLRSSSLTANTFEIDGEEGLVFHDLGFDPTVTKTAGSEFDVHASVSVVWDRVNIFDASGKPYRGIFMKGGAQYKYWVENSEVNGAVNDGITIGDPNGLTSDIVQGVSVLRCELARCLTGATAYNCSGVTFDTTEFLQNTQDGFATYPSAGYATVGIDFVNGGPDTCGRHGYAIIHNGGRVSGISISGGSSNAHGDYGLFVSSDVNDLRVVNVGFVINGQNGFFGGANGLIMADCVFEQNGVAGATGTYDGVLVAGGNNMQFIGNRSGNLDPHFPTPRQRYGFNFQSSIPGPITMIGNQTPGNVGGGYNYGTAPTVNLGNI